MKVFVGIKERIDTDVEFLFSSLMVGQQPGQEGQDYESLNFQKVEAKAIYIETNEDDMDFEEYEFDIVWSPQKQRWVQTLKNGKYLINVKALGYKELNEVI